MRIRVNKLSKEGDTLVTTVDGEERVRDKLQELLNLPLHFVAIEDEVVHSISEAMEKVMGLEEADVLIGRQVAGG